MGKDLMFDLGSRLIVRNIHLIVIVVLVVQRRLIFGTLTYVNS